MDTFRLQYVVCVLIRASFLAWQQQETGKCAFGNDKLRLLLNRTLTFRETDDFLFVILDFTTKGYDVSHPSLFPYFVVILRKIINYNIACIYCRF